MKEIVPRAVAIVIEGGKSESALRSQWRGMGEKIGRFDGIFFILRRGWTSHLGWFSHRDVLKDAAFTNAHGEGEALRIQAIEIAIEPVEERSPFTVIGLCSFGFRGNIRPRFGVPLACVGHGKVVVR